MAPKLNTLTANVSGRVRQERLEGRAHYVAPVVMLVEGVHAGSAGPLLYLGDELGKTPGSWDHKPLTVRHPTANGQHVSACSPAMLNEFKVGLILNSRWDAPKLRAEAWFDAERLKQQDPVTFSAVVGNRVTEVSTGLFSDDDECEGTWNGVPFHAIARNLRPDHLAILPDGVGACSVACGCGLNTNEGRAAMYDANDFELVANGVQPMGLPSTLPKGAADVPGAFWPSWEWPVLPEEVVANSQNVPTLGLPPSTLPIAQR